MGQFETAVRFKPDASCALSVQPNGESAPALLSFAWRDGSQPPSVPLGLELLAGDMAGERWLGLGADERGRHGAIVWARSGGCVSI